MFCWKRVESKSGVLYLGFWYEITYNVYLCWWKIYNLWLHVFFKLDDKKMNPELFVDHCLGTRTFAWSKSSNNVGSRLPTMHISFCPLIIYFDFFLQSINNYATTHDDAMLQPMQNHNMPEIYQRKKKKKNTYLIFQILLPLLYVQYSKIGKRNSKNKKINHLKG